MLKNTVGTDIFFFWNRFLVFGITIFQNPKSILTTNVYTARQNIDIFVATNCFFWLLAVGPCNPGAEQRTSQQRATITSTEKPAQFQQYGAPMASAPISLSMLNFFYFFYCSIFFLEHAHKVGSVCMWSTAVLWVVHPLKPCQQFSKTKSAFFCFHLAA